MGNPDRTVLLIDNTPGQADNYSYLLRQDTVFSYHLIEETYSAQLPTLCQSLPIDGILLEHCPTNLDGLELLSRFQLQLGDVCPPIVMIGNQDISVAVAALKSGAADYLVRDQLTPDTLCVSLRTAIENAELKRQLQRSQEQFQTSIENMLDCFGIFSAIRDESGQIIDFRIDYLNAAACESNHMSREEQIGRRLCEVLPGHRESGLFDEYCRLVDTGVPLIKESLIYEDAYDARRLTRAFDIRASKLKDGFVASWRDVTRQKQLAERFQLAMKAAQMGSWDWDLQTGQVHWSANLQTLFGMTAGSFDGRIETVMAMIHPEDLAHVQESIRRALEEQADYNIEFRFIKPDGSVRWALGLGQVFYDATGTPTKMTGVDMDITDRKQAELDLRDAHIQLESALAAGSIYTWRWDISADRMITSRGSAHLFGISSEDAVNGLPLDQYLQAIHPDDRLTVSAAIERAVATGEDYAAEFRIINADGQERWVIARGRVESNADGQAIAFLGALADITTRKQMEAVLADQEAGLQGFVNSNIIGILQGDIHGNIYWANDAFLRLVGYSRDELQAGQLRWDDITAPEYLPLDYQHIAEAQAQGACTPYEKVYVRRDGRRVPVMIGYSLVGTQEETVVFVLDLTEQKRTEKQLRRSEDRLRMALESTQMGTWDWNLKTDKHTWDAQCKAILGLPADIEENLDCFQALLSPDDRERVNQAIQAALNPAGDGSFDIEYRLVNGQSERWIAAQGQVYFRGQGIPDRFVGTVCDITEQKQAEVDREQLLHREYTARAEAERANRIKDEFLAILSHELRSPLNPILGWAKLLQSKALDADKTARALATIERNAKLQAQLIDDLLDIARILRGKLKLETAPVNLVFVIEAAIETVQSLASDKAITLQADLPDIGHVEGDAARLQQIVWNLLTNAVKFTPDQGQVTVQLIQVDHQAQIVVSDTGMGIRPDFLPHIFESFRQEDTSVTRQFGGLGLGLAIVRYLVEAHGGTITANSPGEGQGATFTVSLPLLENSSNPSSVVPFAAKTIDLTGLRVMVVEDNPDSLELITVCLRQYGATVGGFTTATEALAAFGSFQPDVLVSDIGMPDLDGYALIRKIRALPAHQGGQLPAIAVTAYVREEDCQKALDYGFQAHMAKPVEPGKLGLAIAQLGKRG